MTRAVAGMRGGLGRILLTAFMLLAIVPLSIVSFLAIRRVRDDVRRSAQERLAQVAASASGQLGAWLGVQEDRLSLLARDPSLVRAAREARWEDVCAAVQTLDAQAPAHVVDSAADGRIVCPVAEASPQAGRAAIVTVSARVMDADGRRLCTLSAAFAAHDLAGAVELAVGEQDVRVHLGAEAGSWWSLYPGDGGVVQAPVGVADLSPNAERGSGWFETHAGEPVVAAYRYLPESDLLLWVEQPEEEIAAREDDLAAMLIGSTLAVALLTAVLAAVVTRQLTQPLVRLTVTAVRIASGDLDQTVEVARRDEIGVLAHAFNVMTAELRSLYDGLEQKVGERTQQLTEANRELRYKAMQLKLSAEVGRVATSILDLDLLLARVTRLVLDTYAHVYEVSYVAIWRQDDVGGRAECLAASGQGMPQAVPRVIADDETLIGQTLATGALQTRATDGGPTQVAIPMRIGERVTGALELHCSRSEVIGADDIEALQSLGDQISVAIENAHLYALEREAVERLSRLDDLRLASLGIGSRELATELNTIIGFSRLMLKGADGPLTDLQRADTAAIYQSGYKLLGLIDNVITLAELESGSRRVVQEWVELEVVLEEAVAAARQRVIDVTVECAVRTPIASVQGDGKLLRQALVSLVAASVDQSQQGFVPVEAAAGDRNGDCVQIRIGRAPAQDGQGAEWEPPEHDVEQMEVGVALARRIIALHGGEMHLAFDTEDGLSSLVILPVGGPAPGDHDA